MLRSLSRLGVAAALCGIAVTASAQSPPPARYPSSQPLRQPSPQQRESAPPVRYPQQRAAQQRPQQQAPQQPGPQPYQRPVYPAQRGGYEQGPQPLPAVVPAQHTEGQPGQGPPQQPRLMGPPQAQPPRSPFQLTPEQQAEVDQILMTWETESGKIKSYSSVGFERWEFDPVFGPSGDTAKSKSLGQLKYAKPDKGMFKIEKVFLYDVVSKEYVHEKDAIGEHWVCDGESIFEFNARMKQVIETPLPPELRGKAIADGPLPFLFGAEKKKIEQRYFVQVESRDEEEIWLKAYPKYQGDAANFDYVKIILRRDTFLPKAMMVIVPGNAKLPETQRQRTLYLFPSAKVNDPFARFLGIFEQPRTPFGWTKVVQKAPPEAAQAGNQAPDQARRQLQVPR